MNSVKPLSGSLLAALLVVPLSGQMCTKPSPSTLSAIANAVASKFELAPDLTIEDQGTINGSCFRRMLIHSHAPERIFSLFLSAEQRFVTADIVDLTLDTSSQRESERANVQRLLAADASPTRDDSASVTTVVEFSDFQCLFCKQLYEYVARAREAGVLIREIFKQSPLPQHDWAAKAARLSACAAAQSNNAFWSIHDFLFTNQSSLSSINIEQRVKGVLKERNDIDKNAFSNCANENMPDRLRRDEDLAKQFHVSQTPTVFIDGSRKAGFGSFEDFMASISTAQKNRAAPTRQF